MAGEGEQFKKELPQAMLGGLPKPDYKLHKDRNTEAIKLLGAGNAAGLFAIASLLTSEKVASLPIAHLALKLCAFVFFFGVLAFVYSFWCLYLWAAIVEDELSPYMHEKAPETWVQNETNALFRRIHSLEGYWKTGAVISQIFFVIGCVFIGYGLWHL